MTKIRPSHLYEALEHIAAVLMVFSIVGFLSSIAGYAIYLMISYTSAAIVSAGALVSFIVVVLYLAHNIAKED